MRVIKVVLGLLIVCIIAPEVHAEVFDIGDNTSEIDAGLTNNFYYYKKFMPVF